MGYALVAGQTIAGTSNFGDATFTVALPNNPATGNLVVACMQSSGGGTFTVADGNSNSYTATTSTPFAGSGGALGIFYLKAPSNGDKNVTLTRGTPSGFCRLFVAEYSGNASSSILELDGTATFQGPSATINTPSITTANDGDLLIGITLGYATINSVDSPWTSIGSIQSAAGAEYYIQATHGAQAIAFTQSASNRWDGMAAAFKAAAGAATLNFGWYNREKDERPVPILLSEVRQSFVSNFKTAKTPANWFPASNPDRERPPPIPRSPDEATPFFVRSPNPVPTLRFLPTTGQEDRPPNPNRIRSPDEPPGPFFVRSPNPVPTRAPPTTGADRERLLPIPRPPDEAFAWFVRSPVPVPVRWLPTAGEHDHIKPIARAPDEPPGPWFVRSPNPVPIILLPKTGADMEHLPPVGRSPDEATPFFTRSPRPVPTAWLPQWDGWERPKAVPPDLTGQAWTPRTFGIVNTIAGMAWHNPSQDRERLPPIGRSPDEGTPWFVQSPNPVPVRWMPTTGADVERLPDLRLTDQLWFATWVPLPITGTVVISPAGGGGGRHITRREWRELLDGLRSAELAARELAEGKIKGHRRAIDAATASARNAAAGLADVNEGFDSGAVAANVERIITSLEAAAGARRVASAIQHARAAEAAAQRVMLAIRAAADEEEAIIMLLLS